MTKILTQQETKQFTDLMLNLLKDQPVLCASILKNTATIPVPENKATRVYDVIMPKLRVKRPVKAINLDNNAFEIYECINAASKDLNINCGIVSMCADGIKGVKNGMSKTDDKKYRFEWTTELPTKIVARKSFKREQLENEKKIIQK